MALEDDLATVPASVAIVFVVQRLVEVCDEVDDVLQGLGFRCPVCFGVSQYSEKLLCLGNHAITVGTFPRQVDLRVCQGDIDVVPGPVWRWSLPVVVGPVPYTVNRGAVEQLPGLGPRLAGHVMLGDQGDDDVPLRPPAQDRPERTEQGESSPQREIPSPQERDGRNGTVKASST